MTSCLFLYHPAPLPPLSDPTVGGCPSSTSPRSAHWAVFPARTQLGTACTLAPPWCLYANLHLRVGSHPFCTHPFTDRSGHWCDAGGPGRRRHQADSLALAGAADGRGCQSPSRGRGPVRRAQLQSSLPALCPQANCIWGQSRFRTVGRWGGQGQGSHKSRLGWPASMGQVTQAEH